MKTEVGLFLITTFIGLILLNLILLTIIYGVIRIFV